MGSDRKKEKQKKEKEEKSRSRSSSGRGNWSSKSPFIKDEGKPRKRHRRDADYYTQEGDNPNPNTNTRDKEKKRKDKHRSKRHKDDNLSQALLKTESKKGNFQELSKDDYFSKNNEFATWLKEERRLFFSDLSSEFARELFTDFVKEWNDQKLESRYYEGIANGPRSAHSWAFKK